MTTMAHHQQVLEHLEKVPFFKSFEPEQLVSLSAAGEIRSEAVNTILFKEGEPAQHVFLILDGSVRVVARNLQGQAQEIARLERGRFFGEQALIDGGTRTASVVTAEDSQLFVLSHEQFIQELTRSPQLLSRMMASLSQNIKRSNTQYFQEQLDKQAEQYRLEQQRQAGVDRMIRRIITEFRQPLEQIQLQTSGMDQDLQTIQHLPVSKRLRRAQEQVQQNTARLHLLNESFRSILPKANYAKRESVSWPDFFKEFAEMYQSSSFRHLNIKQQFESEASALTWDGYPHVLMEVLMHLFNNIEVHAYPDERQANVAIELKKESATHFLIKICDRGQGIQPEHLLQVQEPFFSTASESGAMGLGLAIVSNLVQTTLRGAVQIVSQPTKGTCVHLYLPMQV